MINKSLKFKMKLVNLKQNNLKFKMKLIKICFIVLLISQLDMYLHQRDWLNATRY